MTTLAKVFDALKYRVEVDSFGTRRYYNSANQLHSDAGPAVVWHNGDEEWYQNGLRHCDVGPAVVDANGASAWYQNGLLHCVAGPAVVWPDSVSAWWLKGVRHRINGPAVEHTNGNKEWWLNGKKYTQQEYCTLLKTLEQVHGY